MPPNSIFIFFLAICLPCARPPGAKPRKRLSAAWDREKVRVGGQVAASVAPAAGAPAAAEVAYLDEDSAQTEMLTLIDEYIREGSPQQVNIPGGLQKTITSFDSR